MEAHFSCEEGREWVACLLELEGLGVGKMKPKGKPKLHLKSKLKKVEARGVCVFENFLSRSFP